MSKSILAILFGAMLLAIILAGPLFVIWAWNTLFGAVHLIPYTVWTWLAVLILGVFISPNVRVTKKS